MAWKVRIDTLRTDPSGRHAAFLSSQTLSGSGSTPVTSTVSTGFGAADGVALDGAARVTVLAGAVIATWTGVSPVSDGDGLRLEVGAGADLPFPAGARLAFIEAADAPTPREQHLGEVGGSSGVALATFTRPANTTAYAIGQLVANSTTAGSMAPLALACARKAGGTGLVRRVRVSSSNPATVGASLRVHLFKTPPTSTVGDGGAFAGAVNGVTAVHLGACDVVLDRGFSDGAKGIGAPGVGSDILFDTAAGSANLYALIEARSAYTPLSGETLTVAAEVLRD